MSDVKANNDVKDVKIGFIADGVKQFSKKDIFHDSSFALMLATQELKAKILLTGSNNLKIINNKVFANFDEIDVKQEAGNHIHVKESYECSLDSLDIIFARKVPPVNENFISYLQMLTLVQNVLIINKPNGVLGANEKLYALNFPDLIPPTLVSSNKNEIVDFLNEYGEAVIKPLFNKGGEGVFYLNKNDLNGANLLIDSSISNGKFSLAQMFIKEVKLGDKRIILLNGHPIGALLRIPKPGEFRANMNQGASIAKCELRKRDLEICEELKPYLIKDGLYFAGIDVIDKYLTEVNVTSPTCLQEIERFTHRKLAREIVEWAIEKRLIVGI